MSDIDVQSDQPIEDPEPQEVEPPIDPITQDYGTVLHFKSEAAYEKADSKVIADADVVIVDLPQSMIVKNREGVIGIVATPDILSVAEVQG